MFLPLATAAVAATLWLLMPAASRRLWRHPDFLVPLGWLILASNLLVWAQRWSLLGAVLKPSFTPRIGFFGLGTLSLGWLLQLVLEAAYATWVTLLVWSTIRADRCDLRDSLARSPRSFLRVFGLECIGWAVNHLLVASTIVMVSFVGMKIAPFFGRFGVLPIYAAFLLMGAVAVAWNLATTAWLLVAVDGRLGFFATIQHGLRTSLSNLRHWCHLVVVQLLLLGFWAFVTYTYQHNSGPGSQSTNFSLNYHFNYFWVGGYEHHCVWYQEFMKLVGAPPLQPVATLLLIPFALLASAIKLTLAHRLAENEASATEIPQPPVIGATGS